MSPILAAFDAPQPARGGWAKGPCGKAVEETWNGCACPVAQTLFRAPCGANSAQRTSEVQLRIQLRLRAAPASLQSVLAARARGLLTHPVTPLRIHETINGRAYVIEVRLVAADRWRAQISGAAGTTALMPFYGRTPDDAAERLTGWLSRASRPAAQAPQDPPREKPNGR
jgi:hypothetical protein